MPEFLIEVKHGDGHTDLIRALDAIERCGSRYSTHADRGCKAGTHCSWMIADLESRKPAAQMASSKFRKDSRVVRPNRLTEQEVASFTAKLDG
jgi:hypothetical protein